MYDLNEDYENKLAKRRAASWATGDRAALLDEVRRVAGIRKLAQLPKPPVEVLDTLIRSGYRIQKLVIRPEEGISLPALWFLPDRPKMGAAVLYLHERGKAADAGPGGPIEQRVQAGQTVLAVDLRGTGQTRSTSKGWNPPEVNDDYVAYMLGRCCLGMRAEDILISARYAAERAGAVQLVAIGNVGVPALHAAAVEADLFQSVTLSRTLVSWSNVIHSRLQQRPAVDLVHGALVYYDLPNLAATLGDKLKIEQPVDARALSFSRSSSIFNRNGTIMEPLRILTSSQLEQIDTAAQTILERTGVKVDSPEALGYLKRFGCQVDDQTGLVKIPRQLTRQVIAKMRQDYQRPERPERVPVRFSHVRFRQTEFAVHQDFTVSTGGFCCFINDLGGQRRTANGDDVLCAINMVNHLDQIDYTGLPVSDQTVPADHRPVVMAAKLVKWTKKIGGIETLTKEDVRWVHEIAQIAAGSAEEFRRRPALVGYGEMRTPLCFDRNMAEVFMEYVKLGVPQTVDSMPAGGSTAPVTAAAILALGAAESLAGMVLGYAVRDDAVVGMDITPSYTDMRTGLFKYSGCDRWNLLMARVQLLSEYYGCPAGVHGGKTDSCFHNEHAGAEKMASMLLPVLAGAVAIGTVGHVENAITFSPLQLVIDSELARYVRRSIRSPWEVNDETLATELIHAIGPGGNFLSERHTSEHFRDEVFLSPLSPVRSWADAHGKPEQYDQTEKARQIAAELWRKPEEPVLSDDQIRAIDAIVGRATK